MSKYTKAILTGLLAMAFFGLSSQAAEVWLTQTKLPAIPAEIKSSQKSYSKIESAVITDSLGRVARGLHNVYVTVKDSAPYALIVQGQEIKPGETKIIAINLSNTGNRLSIPVHPASGQIEGIAEYEIVIDNIRVDVCPEYFTEGASDCYRIITKIADMSCQLGMEAVSPDKCRTTSIVNKVTSCESGYTLNGETCERVQLADKVDFCPDGLSLTAEGKCEKTAYTPISPCPEGAKFDGVSCKTNSLEPAINGICPEGTTANPSNPNFCDKTVITVPVLQCSGQTVTTTESCSVIDGAEQCLSYSLEYGSCVQRTSLPSAQKCPAGFSENANGQCELSESYKLNIYCDNGYTQVDTTTCSRVETITGDPYCEPGYNLAGWGCTKSLSQSATPNCASGYTWNGTTCSQTLTTNPNITCSPSAAYYNGTQCQYDQTKSATGSCSQGSWSGGSCTWTDQTSPTSWDCPGSHPNPSTVYGFKCYAELPSSPQEEGCPAGYEWRLHRCVQYAEPVNIQCPSGYYWDGSYCSKTFYSSPDYYYCTSGWTLSGTKCNKTTYSTPTYTCPSGYTLNGTTCSKTTTQAPSSYGCESGWTLSGTTCTQTLTEPAKASCPTGYTNDGPKNCSKTLTLPAKALCPVGYAERYGKCEKEVSLPATLCCEAPYLLDPLTQSCKNEVRVPKYL